MSVEGSGSHGETNGEEGMELSDDEVFYSSDRAKAFIDAVVAIAMTLLILPLLETITSTVEAHGEHKLNGAQWFHDNYPMIVNFLISFAVIAIFWINHHRMFAGVRRVTSVLLWINVAWLLTIVWLPVATAMTGVGSSGDPIIVVSYIGTMVLTSLAAFGQELFLRAHPRLHDIPPDRLARGLGASLSMCVLFGASLAIALLVPEIGYYALLLLFATSSLRGVFGRMFRPRR
ncbi:TMEM175 family protein [Humibacter ginsenosidimutans]|uniref:DUF1211 domain-containing protein n=1 Tax=Humibacter ginsenosidimutans TaxID=2599293 RepID=A0A5B8M5N6_9MICO|nr:TMEM175 family protein [Humibacter ginsenosidimutans]QDZ15399.1 DUF1211 domain-containing protein [Humibacter ginsenosidimutans]